jgi:hypothetical protein
MQVGSTWLVHIEFRSVQPFLFAVPRLRAMLGANVILGELLRDSLPKALDGKTVACPGLLRETPVTDPVDPLASHDDLEVALQGGILSQDGGHFEAAFPSEKQAQDFAERASSTIRSSAPGLAFDVHVRCAGATDARPVSTSRSTEIVELPQFQPCEATGGGVAHKVRSVSSKPGDTMRVSLAAYRRFDAGNRLASGKSNDWVGLLQEHLPLKDLPPPSTLEELAGDDYLAVIHADGFSIGSRSDAYANQETDTGPLARHVRKQLFFHRMRSVVRACVVRSLREVFTSGTGHRPFQLMMLGGDDLLLVCRAPYALPWLVAYAKELGQRTLADKQPLCVNAGVVVSRPSVPFHRLHTMADSLASSAKRLARASVPSGSTADWVVFSGAWSDDPIGVRQRDWVVHSGTDTLVLSGRPLPILGSGLETVEGLCRAAVELEGRVRSRQAARSQLRTLIESLPLGKLHADLAWQSLAVETQRAMRAAGVVGPWTSFTSAPNTHLSRLIDLVEVFEIGRLGRQTRSDPAAVAVEGEAR